MIRNFVAGVVWGGVVAGLGLAVISEVAKLPGEQEIAQPELAEVVSPESLPAVQAEPLAPVVAEPVPAVEAPLAAQPEAPVVAALTEAPLQSDLAVTVPAGADPTVLTPVQPTSVAPLPENAPFPDLAPLAEAAPQAEAQVPPQVLAQAPDVVAEAPQSMVAPEVAQDIAPVEPAAVPGLDVSPSTSEARPALAELPQPLAPEVKEVLLQPSPEAAPMAVTPEPLPQIGAQAAQDPAALPQIEAAPDLQPAPETVTVDPGLPKLADRNQPAMMQPDAALPSATSDGSLPQIGKEVAPTEDQANAIPDHLMRLPRYARNYIAEGDKPRFAVVLIDNGSADLDRAKLAALPFAVTFAIDPLAANATEAETIYRAGGQEVVILANGIPEGATPADLEQSLQTISAALPESVALLDLDSGGFQNNRALASQVVSILKAQGRGMLTYDKGLNAADQEARREDLPAAKVFRMIDGGNEEAPVIRRYLDRAAFKAAQDGHVVVVGHTRPETITALLEWTVEGRAASVSMAPASAVMQAN